MLTEQITKMDCDRCRLRTEHYLLKNGDVLIMCRCLRCGQLERNFESVPSGEHYPIDDCRPMYVV